MDSLKCAKVAPSAAAELSWVLNLLVDNASYALPALDELDQSLVPGIAALREPTKRQYGSLWNDEVAGCPELVVLAHHAGCLFDTDQRRLLRWLAETTNHAAAEGRLRRLCGEGALRQRYREILERVWEAIRRPWQRDGLRVSTEASDAWRKRIANGGHIDDLVAPRHPLANAERSGLADLWTGRSEYVLSPLFFCLSGGHAVDLGEYVHIAVPASDLLPIRKVRDAMFVADRLRVLAEPTRVHILIQLMSAPAGVMDLSRTLRLSQPAVSGHIKVLRRAELVQKRKLGSRDVFVVSRKRVERLLEDARATLARWD